MGVKTKVIQLAPLPHLGAGRHGYEIVPSHVSVHHGVVRVGVEHDDGESQDVRGVRIAEHTGIRVVV